MDNTAMEKQPYDDKARVPGQVIQAARQIGSKAMHAAGDGLGKVAEATEKNVKRYPLAAVGIALGSGVIIGTLGTLLFRPRPPTLKDRFYELELGDRVNRLFKKLF